jgi:hypothetical protein
MHGAIQKSSRTAWTAFFDLPLSHFAVIKRGDLSE